MIAGLVLGGSGCRTKNGPPQDAGPFDGHPLGAALDADLPETVVVILEGGADPGKPTPSATAKSRYVTLLSGLPTPCQDTSRQLGLVTFAQSGDDVVITSSKTKARATCSVKDSRTLICDWIGMNGEPSLEGSPVTYGANQPIGGAIDKKHRFACKPQP